jgi:hypothetical protein
VLLEEHSLHNLAARCLADWRNTHTNCAESWLSAPLHGLELRPAAMLCFSSLCTRVY